VLLVVVVCLLVDSTDAGKRRRRRRKGDGERRRQMRRNKDMEKLLVLENEIEELEKKEYPQLQQDVAIELRDRSNEIEPEEEDDEEDEEDTSEEEDSSEDTEVQKAPQSEQEVYIDVCDTHYCGAGKECVKNESGEPHCQCATDCPRETDPRRKTCSNHNETWDGDCLLYQMRCWCHEESEKCTEKEYKHLHVDYYGVCQAMPECLPSELSEFPERMRDWLYNIMRDLADRQELSHYYLQLERENEDDPKQRWANAVVWKWCDLDGNPADRKISRHELFPIRAPLITLEHCIAPFLDGCDKDDDHYITLEEWGTCLGLDIEEIEDKCEKISENLD